MTDLRKAAEMALQALEAHADIGIKSDKAVEALRQALRQALAEPKQESLGGEWVPCVKLPVIVHVRNQRKGEAHISTREGITPVLPDDLIMRGVAGEEYPIGRELFERTYTFDTAPPKQEYQYEVVAEHANGTYTTKRIPKREWVGLSDEEIYDYADKFLYQHGSNYGIKSFGKAIEAKLKEKNGG